MKLFNGHSVRQPADDVKLRRLLAHQFERIAQSFEGLRAEQVLVRDLRNGLLEGKQMPSQIPAVHGRDISWRQGRERLRVVPIQVMSSDFLEFFERRERKT